jgi:hypothetical protein
MKRGWRRRRRGRGVHQLVVMHQVECVQYIFFPEIRL